MAKNKVKPFQQKRKLWYRNLKKIMKIRYKKPDFVYLGEKPSQGAIILSNHVGTEAPMSLEIYADFPPRMWGAAEMNSGLVSLYKYQTRVYYHQKKKWNIHLARLFCLIASPLTNLFYKGLRLISTYRDYRLKVTINESIEAIRDNKDNIVIFPERSDEGYLDVLTGFHSGFVMLADQCLKNNIDVPIYVCYLKLSEMEYIFSSPYRYSELKEKYGTRKEIANFLVNECNRLGTIDVK